MLCARFCNSPLPQPVGLCFFFFNDTATTEIYTLSLHDALPILNAKELHNSWLRQETPYTHKQPSRHNSRNDRNKDRSEEHTSELQSRQYLVCRLLLEKKKKQTADTSDPENTDAGGTPERRVRLL